MQIKIIAAVHFAYEPALEFQERILVLAAVQREMLQGALRSHLAPPDRQTVFHRYAEPELAPGHGRAFQGNAWIFGEGKQEVRVVLDGGDTLVQALDDGRSGKLIDRIPTVGSVILNGRTAPGHSPDFFPDCAPL